MGAPSFFFSFFSICALYICAALPIFVFFQPNLEDMLKITQITCTLNFVSLSASLLLLGCFQVEGRVTIYLNLSIFLKVFFKGKIGFMDIK